VASTRLAALSFALFFGVPSSAVADFPAELIARRSRYAKHYALPDGTVKAVIGAAPRHYQDLMGDWQEIVLGFHSAPAAESWNLGGGTSPIRIRSWYVPMPGA